MLIKPWLPPPPPYQQHPPATCTLRQSVPIGGTVLPGLFLHVGRGFEFRVIWWGLFSQVGGVGFG